MKSMKLRSERAETLLPPPALLPSFLCAHLYRLNAGRGAARSNTQPGEQHVNRHEQVESDPALLRWNLSSSCSHPPTPRPLEVRKKRGKRKNRGKRRTEVSSMLVVTELVSRDVRLPAFQAASL
ncbi:hypothetical protein EYF80_055009 [Liparis tanakae]|uniref:Uncharacterized protein n=1 Tax=Liparis tanakae TaxID=230148 RepID=A0A4Z2F232_9TELE|nr:hypothetical protein EYF80_055009 [Liparis tanakae]